jgi:hypothetical protein
MRANGHTATGTSGELVLRELAGGILRPARWCSSVWWAGVGGAITITMPHKYVCTASRMGDGVSRRCSLWACDDVLTAGRHARRTQSPECLWEVEKAPGFVTAFSAPPNTNSKRKHTCKQCSPRACGRP